MRLGNYFALCICNALSLRIIWCTDRWRKSYRPEHALSVWVKIIGTRRCFITSMEGICVCSRWAKTIKVVFQCVQIHRDVLGLAPNTNVLTHSKRLVATPYQHHRHAYCLGCITLTSVRGQTHGAWIQELLLHRNSAIMWFLISLREICQCLGFINIWMVGVLPRTPFCCQVAPPWGIPRIIFSRCVCNRRPSFYI